MNKVQMYVMLLKSCVNVQKMGQILYNDLKSYIHYLHRINILSTINNNMYCTISSVDIQK